MVEVLVDFDKKAKWPPAHTYEHVCRCRSITGQKTLEYHHLQPPTLLFREKYIPPLSKMDKETIYSESYCDYLPQPKTKLCEYEKRNEYLPVEVNPDIYHTVQELSYTHPSELEMTESCKRPGGGAGLKHSTDYMTTHKKDFTFKMPPKKEPRDMSKEFIRSSVPMECTSINHSSYRGWPVEEFGRKRPTVTSYQGKYLPSKSKMENESVSHSNFPKYQVPLDHKVPPWVEKERAYIAPKSPFRVNTIYNQSFSSPGMYTLKERPPCKACYCMRPGECFNEDNQIPMRDVCPSTYTPGCSPERPPPIVEKKAGL